MNTFVQKWGNSQGIRLPKFILEQVGFSENEEIEIIPQDDIIILRKVNKKKHIMLSERMEDFYGKSIDDIENIEAQEEEDFGYPVGDEEW